MSHRIKIHNVISKLQRLQGELSLVESSISAHIEAGGNYPVQFQMAANYSAHSRGHLLQAIELLDTTRKATS